MSAQSQSDAIIHATADAIMPPPVVNDVSLASFALTQVTRITEDAKHEFGTQVTRLQQYYESRVTQAVQDAQAARQKLEDTRAVRRNRNRILTMLVVLAMELIIPTLAGWGLLPPLIIHYEVLAITAPDLALTAYAFHKRY
jgi:hypothetical protein